PTSSISRSHFPTGYSLLSIPRNSENQPSFPRAFSSQDRYNRGELLTPLPAPRKLLYSEGIGRGFWGGGIHMPSVETEVEKPATQGAAMEITVSRQDLVKELTATQSVVERKTTI